jgi:hypothetical protein
LPRDFRAPSITSARTISNFLEVFDKADRPLPNWVLDVEAGDPDALAAANEWLVSDLAHLGCGIPTAHRDGSAWRSHLKSSNLCLIPRHYVSRIQSLC